MKVKLLVTLFLIVCQFSFSQTEKLLKGIVLHENFLLEKVEVINKTTKISTITNGNGEFVIQAKANDSLLFYAKGYQMKRIKLTPQQIERNNLVIAMLKKAEELDEVVVTTLPPIKWKIDKKWERDRNDQIALENKANAVKNKEVYDGTIENGMDFMRIGKMIFGLFIKEKDTPKEKDPEIEFAVLAKSICEENFYFKTLKLKPDEIDLFLQFCDADPKSKNLISDHNKLSMMDFLMTKNKEFQKLKEAVK